MPEDELVITAVEALLPLLLERGPSPGTELDRPS